AECMIRQPEDFKVYRAAEGAADGPKAWRPLRHGIADLHRRAEVSQSANERYLDALAAVHDTTPIRELTEPLCRPVADPGRRRGSTTPAAAQSGAADLEQQGVAAPAGDNALAFGPTQAMEPATATPAAPPPSSSGGRLAAEEGEPVMASPGPRAKEPSAAATASMTAGLVAALAVCAPAGAEPQVTEACPGTQPGTRKESRAAAPPRRVRALNPLGAADAALLEAVSRHEFMINGLRNRDLRRLLHGSEAATAVEQKRRAAAVTRQLRLLRAHGLMRKVPRTHRYMVSEAGRRAITGLLAARNACAEELIRCAG